MAETSLIILLVSINNSLFFLNKKLNKNLNPLYLVISPFQFNYIFIHSLRSYLFLSKFQDKIKSHLQIHPIYLLTPASTPLQRPICKPKTVIPHTQNDRLQLQEREDFFKYPLYHLKHASHRGKPSFPVWKPRGHFRPFENYKERDREKVDRERDREVF